MDQKQDAFRLQAYIKSDLQGKHVECSYNSA